MEFHPVAEIFPMMTADEYAALRADIAANGLLEPIWTHDGKIIDGRNRYQACAELGIEPTTREWDGRGSLTAFVVSLNLHRRHLDTGQRAMIADSLAQMRQGERTDLSENSERLSQADAAKLLNVSVDSLGFARKVRERGTPELIAAAESGILPVSQAARLVAATPEVQRQVVEKIASGEAKNANIAARQIKYESMIEPPPMGGKYRVVYADPPWHYSNSGLDEYGHAAKHYPSMTIAELCAMPVADILEDNAVLFLWVTSPLLDECFPVIKAWGFKYKSSFVWDKVRPNFGYYNSVRHEFLLICTRGSCTPDVPELVDSVQEIERTGRHSEKPQEFRALIDRLYPHGARVELFARAAAPGWSVWGNQVEVACGD